MCHYRRGGLLLYAGGVMEAGGHASPAFYNLEVKKNAE